MAEVDLIQEGTYSATRFELTIFAGSSPLKLLFPRNLGGKRETVATPLNSWPWTWGERLNESYHKLVSGRLLEKKKANLQKLDLIEILEGSWYLPTQLVKAQIPVGLSYLSNGNLWSQLHWVGVTYRYFRLENEPSCSGICPDNLQFLNDLKSRTRLYITKRIRILLPWNGSFLMI